MWNISTRLPESSQGELYTRSVEVAQSRFSDSEFQGTQTGRHKTYTLRVIQDDRLASVTSSKPDSLSELVDDALNLVPYGRQLNYAFPGAADVELLDLTHRNELTLDDMTAVAADLAGAVMQLHPQLRVFSELTRKHIEIELTNTNGFTGQYSKTVWDVALAGRLVQGDDFLSVMEFRSSTAADFDYSGLKENVTERLEQAQRIVPIEAGKYPVIFAPAQVGYVLRPLVASLNGKAFARGISPLIDRLGEPFVDQRIKLVDDGRLPQKPTSAPFDREGVPTRKTVLVEQGRPTAVLLDLQTATELEAESTGNATGQGPAPHHLLLEPGTAACQELKEQLDEGILVYNTMGAWAGNPYSGHVSGTLSLAFKLEGGEVVGRIKNCMFSLNAFEQLRSGLIGLTQETEEVTATAPGLGGATLPYLALEDVVISTE